MMKFDFVRFCSSAVVYKKVTNLSIKINGDKALCNLLLFEPILKLAVNWAHLPPLPLSVNA